MSGQPSSLPDQESEGARLPILRWPGLAAIAAVVAAAGWLGMAEIAVLAVLLLSAGLVARAWAALALVGLAYERRLEGDRAFPGETIGLSLTVDNRKLLPLSWVRVEEPISSALAAPDDPAVSFDADGKARLSIVTPLGWRSRATLTRRLACTRRGCYTIGPARLMSSDVFGLFVRGKTAAPQAVILVYPRLYDVADLLLPARNPLGPDRDPRRLFEDTSRPAGIREYTQDTPFKTINWKATARTGALHATVYDTTVTQETVVLLAVDSFPEGAEEAFERGVSAVASIAARELDLGRPVGVFANGMQALGHGPVFLPLGSGPERRRTIFEALARLERRTELAFPAFLDAAAPMIGARARIIVVADRADTPLLARLQDLGRRGRSVILLSGEASGDDAPGLLRRRIVDLLTGQAA